MYRLVCAISLILVCRYLLFCIVFLCVGVCGSWEGECFCVYSNRYDM